MEKIINYLKNRPAISINTIEKLCNIPIGTIRLNGTKNIPVKYKAILTEILSIYGFSQKSDFQADSIVNGDKKLPKIKILNKKAKYKGDGGLSPDEIVKIFLLGLVDDYAEKFKKQI